MDFQNKKGIFFVLGIFFLSIIAFGFRYTDGKAFSNSDTKVSIVLNNLVGMNIDDVEVYAEENKIALQINYQYHSSIPEGQIISQNKEAGMVIEEGEVLEVVVSKGKVPSSIYQEHHVNGFMSSF